MDSTALAIIAENTAATAALTGTLWVFGGLLCVMLCGALIIKYTLKG